MIRLHVAARAPLALLQRANLVMDMMMPRGTSTVLVLVGLITCALTPESADVVGGIMWTAFFYLVLGLRRDWRVPSAPANLWLVGLFTVGFATATFGRAGPYLAIMGLLRFGWESSTSNDPRTGEES